MASSYSLAKDLGEIQYNLMLIDLNSLPEKEKSNKMQKYWNEFRAILNVSPEHAELMESKYMPLLFAYQNLFNFKGGCIPNIGEINTKSDTSAIEEEIIKYLKDKNKV